MNSILDIDVPFKIANTKKLMFKIKLWIIPALQKFLSVKSIFLKNSEAVMIFKQKNTYTLDTKTVKIIYLPFPKEVKRIVIFGNM